MLPVVAAERETLADAGHGAERVPERNIEAVPSARTGKGSTSGEMPFLGSPASQVVPASLVSCVLVAREKPNWSRQSSSR